MNLYPVRVVARVFEQSVATIFVNSLSCGSVSQYVTRLTAYLCNVFLLVFFAIIMCSQGVLWSCWRGRILVGWRF